MDFVDEYITNAAAVKAEAKAQAEALAQGIAAAIASFTGLGKGQAIWTARKVAAAAVNELWTARSRMGTFKA